MCCMHGTVVLCMSISHNYAQWLWLLMSIANEVQETNVICIPFTDREIGRYTCPRSLAIALGGALSSLRSTSTVCTTRLLTKTAEERLSDVIVT
jgi:hypothetical protein